MTEEVAIPFQMDAADATNMLDYMSKLDSNCEISHVRLTGIICTIGPASRYIPTLEKLMQAGINIVRLNLSHGSYEYHAETIKNIRIAAENYSKKIGTVYPVGIALDTRGPEIRTGFIDGMEHVELKRNAAVKLTTDKAYENKCTKDCIYIDYDNLTKVVKPGNHIYINDGLICLVVENIQGSFLTCTIEIGGILGSRKSCNLPEVHVDLPTLSERDKNDLRFAIDQKIDIILASLIHEPEAVIEIKETLGELGRKILVISKIGTYEALKNLDEIIEVSDGIVVARGKLGLHIPDEKIFIAQKNIIGKCNKIGRPVVFAMHVFDTMKRSGPKHTNGLDIANAILDGADCILLYGEKPGELFPMESISIVANICREAEASIWQRQTFLDLRCQLKPPLDVAHTIAIATVEAATLSLCSAIIAVTTSGTSAHLISKYRPRCPVIAITRNPQTARQSHIYRSILPVFYEYPRSDDWLRDLDARVNASIKFGKLKGFIKTGDSVAVVTGWKEGVGFTNTLRIVFVADDSQNICTHPSHNIIK